MRPISVTSILSRLTERLVVRNFFKSAMADCFDLSNQFAYQTTCSSTSALIAILSHVTQLLKTYTHVHIITFDYSKAFDTLSHSSVASSLARLAAPDCIYNWVLDFLSNRSHVTQFHEHVSSSVSITADVIQGSVLGPTLFNLSSSSLKPLSPINKYFKYADDGYLVVPSGNAATIPLEIKHHEEWALDKNLKLNVDKTVEIIIVRRRCKVPDSTPGQGVTRVPSLKILGVIFDEHLSFQSHISEVIKNCSQTLFALRTMRQHGLDNKSLMQVFSAKILTKITYACPSWWGFISTSSRQQLESFLNKAIKFGYYPPNHSNFAQIVETQECNLFHSIASNSNHCLYHLLPPKKQTNYDLRRRGHDFILPLKDDCNFIERCLFKYI